ncbi:MAG: succinate dehydrogenase, cytochrome b556 subunit [Alphaproteobacteria bacterium]|nr:MAG: succinate dehydrogenase, cytochrome b556 subunit [Alphaproteobacteria bacterium]
MSSQKPSGVQRPLSPHLGIYKPQISSVLSIMHRASGVFLSLGSLVFAVWIFCAAYNPIAHETVNVAFTSTIGTMFLIAWSAAFYYHASNGVRHLFWDMGKGFSIRSMTKSGIAVLCITATCTIITWMIILNGVSYEPT